MLEILRASTICCWACGFCSARYEKQHNIMHSVCFCSGNVQQVWQAWGCDCLIWQSFCWIVPSVKTKDAVKSQFSDVQFSADMRLVAINVLQSSRTSSMSCLSIFACCVLNNCRRFARHDSFISHISAASSSCVLAGSMFAFVFSAVIILD